MTTIADVVAALQGAMTAVQAAASVAQAYVEPTPAPDPLPSTTPPPDPVIVSRQLDITHVVCLLPQYPGWDRYLRSGTLWYVTKPGTVDFTVTDISDGGVLLNFAYPEYGLLFNGVERARCKPGATHRATFTFALGNEQGHVLAEIVAYDATGARVATPTESLSQFWFIVDQNGTAKDLKTVIRQNGTFEWTHPQTAYNGLPPHPGVYSYVELPLDMAQPAASPLTPRTLQAITPGCASSLLTRTGITIPKDNDHASGWRTVWNRAGVPSAENLQPYYPEDAGLHEPMFPTPRLSTIDGERGVAMLNPVLSVRHAHANGLWFTDAWAARAVDGRGKVRTLYGLRHKRPRYSGHDVYSPLPYYEPPVAIADDPNVEIVNENSWPADVPREQRFAHESWSFEFDDRTVGIDPNRPKLPVVVNGVETMLAQHAMMPTSWQTCRLGRMIRARFHGNTDNLPAGYTVDAKGYPRDSAGNYVDLHDLPPIIDVPITGRADPWAHVTVDGVLYLTERGRHAISMWSADDGSFIGDLISNPTASRFGAVNERRRFAYTGFSYNDVLTGVAAKATRGDSIVAPEGLGHWKDTAGDLWLYWGSYAQGEVRRINVRTKQVQVVCRPFVGWEAKSWYVYVRVSPQGVVGTTTWSEQNMGPELFLPVPGTAADGTALTHSKKWNWADVTMKPVLAGPGGYSVGMAYISAFDISDDRITVSSSMAQLDEWTLSPAGAVAPDLNRCAAGFAWYKARTAMLLEDSLYPLPVGQNSDFDYWLKYSGR